MKHHISDAFLFAGFMVACSSPGCGRTTPSPARPFTASESTQLAEAQSNAVPAEVEAIFDGELKNGWQDWGWAPRERDASGAMKIDFSGWGGWILSKPSGAGKGGDLMFRVKPIAGELDYLKVYLFAEGREFPRVDLTPQISKKSNDGWFDVRVPIARLNPDDHDFDRIFIQARRSIESASTLVDKIVMAKAAASKPKAPKPTLAETMQVDCSASPQRISPYIYGFAFYPFRDATEQAAQWMLEGSVRRWGGNATSTYNWEIGAWNTGADWFFENHPISHEAFLSDNRAHSIASALTVPIMGWVAKDTSTYSFPVSTYGTQQATDSSKADAGNGKKKNGDPLKPESPPRGYRSITPEYVKRWVESIRRTDSERGQRSIWMYILDNEPMIWSSTHLDAHPEPLSYDELLERTIAYGTAVRQADPEAQIAGPAEWGWTSYLYSGKDMANGGVNARPDRRAHDDLPVVAYYLKKLAEHERKTGVRILDVLDLHGYPYGPNVATGDFSDETAALRVRSTRMLWDPSYVDESWVKEPVMLLP
ncbi:MAG TPA: glycoside hydrolase family 44 protein, partial [Polyangiaceae bacterium]